MNAGNLPEEDHALESKKSVSERFIDTKKNLATCKFCGCSGLQWSENPDSTGKNYLFNENTGKKHKEDCKPSAAFQKASAALYGRAIKIEDDPRKVRLFDTVDGIQFYRQQDRIAHDIIENSIKLGKKDPYNVEVVIAGDFLIIK